MEYSYSGQILTKKSEGFSLKAYLDSSGVPTIGWGHTDGVRMGDICTISQANEWLMNDVQVIVDRINADITVPLTQGQFDALVDFGFNLGDHALQTSTLWKLLNSGDYAGAAAQFPRWDHAGGVEVEGLLRRRLAEKSEFNGDADGLNSG
jgi:lysozyme